MKRLSELTLIEERLAEYRNANGQYPVLSSGSYLPYKTLSVWPSWQDELGRMLGGAIPVDPVNALGICSTLEPDRYSPVTCWDKETISFAGDLVNSPYVFLGGRIYFYNTTDPYNYELCAAMETAGAPYTNLDSNACSALSTSNSAPNLTVGALNGHPNSSFEAFINYSDPEGDAIGASTITAISPWGGTNLTIAPSSTNLLRIYTPTTDSNVGSYNFNITVEDIYGNSTPRSITINLGNQAPVLDLSSCSTVNAISQSYLCNFNYFDPEGDTFTVESSTTTPAGSGLSVDFASSTISGTTNNSGSYNIEIEIEDEFGANNTKSYTLNVYDEICGDGIIQTPNDFFVNEVCDGPGGGTGPNDQYGCAANCLSWQGGYCGDSATQYLEGEECDYNLTAANVNAMRSVISYWQGSTTPINRLPIYRIRDIYQDDVNTRCQNDCTFACGATAIATSSLDSDIYNDCFDNCPNMSNIGQFDADQDNVGDLCDPCYSYNGSCVELTVQQGAWSRTIVPYVGQRSSEDFYCYAGNCNACTDGDPYTLCSIAGASSNMTAYEITSSDRSEIFAYIDAPNPLAPMLSLGFVHDAPSDVGGGRAFFDFSGSGWTSATISAKDDDPVPPQWEFDKILSPPGHWTWLSCCTDGGMIDIDYLNNGWSLTMTPNPGFTPNDGGTTLEWFAKKPGGVLSGESLPSTSTPVTITYNPN